MHELDERSPHLLSEDDSEAEKLALKARRPRLGLVLLTRSGLSILIAGSVLLFLARLIFPKTLFCPNQNLSPYVGLKANRDDRMHWNTEYSDENETLVDHNWVDSIPWESGIIALTKNEVHQFDLPESQPFPWDPEDKALYIVNAHHILHCVRNLYISIREYRHNKPQSVSYPHILHCLDTIRIETMCTADDTPRYVPPNSMHGLRPGEGQERKCRDWSQLQEFVLQHDPCYKYIYPDNDEFPNLERFKYCPNDSPYLPKIRKHFGLEEDWKPWP